MTVSGDDHSAAAASAPIGTLPSGDGDEITTRARALMLEMAEDALRKGDDKRFDQLIGRVLSSGTPATSDAAPSAHETKMDRNRYIASILLVVLLAVVIGLAIYGPKTANGQAATTYVSLLSGLAGIALGWLFGSSSSHGTTARESGKSKP